MPLSRIRRYFTRFDTEPTRTPPSATSEMTSVRVASDGDFPRLEHRCPNCNHLLSASWCTDGVYTEEIFIGAQPVVVDAWVQSASAPQADGNAPPSEALSSSTTSDDGASAGPHPGD